MKKCDKEGCGNIVWSKGRCRYHPKPKMSYGANESTRKPIKKISDKRKKQRALYSVLRKMFLEENPKCAVFPELDAIEIHHRNHCENERLNNTEYWLAVSREGHLRIHKFPEESYSKGWLIKG